MANHTNIFDLVKDRVSIVDALGRILHLKRAGSRWVSVCPFHKDTEPSFYVNEDRQNYRCFGCGASGDVISFYEKHYNLTALEAVEKLAGEYGIDLPERGRFTGKSRKDPMYEINGKTGRFYYQALRKEDCPGLLYMKDRGISDETRKAFALGYAPGGSSLARHLTSEGAPEQLAAELGLIHQRDGGYYDRYRNRLIFPIVNTLNRVVGFGARAIDKDDKPKYINSAESTIFSKKRHLYGIHITKDAIREADCCILVEGYMDAIALYQFGIRNVAATLGTALTMEHARLIKRFTSNVVLSFDSDAAGVASALKGIDVLRAEGLSVKVLVVEDQKDPDDFIRRHGKEAFAEAVSGAMPAIDFMLLKVREGKDLDAAEGAIVFLKEAVEVLRKVSPVEADYYIMKLAEDTGIAEGAIRMETWGDGGRPGSDGLTGNAGRTRGDAGRARPFQAGGPDEAAEDEGDPAAKLRREADGIQLALQRNFIALALHDPMLLDEIRTCQRIFVTPIYERVYQCLWDLSLEDADGEQLMELDNRLEEEELAAVQDIRTSVMIGESPRQQLSDCIDRLELYDLRQREKELLDILKFNGSDDELSGKIAEELRELQSDIVKLKER